MIGLPKVGGHHHKEEFGASVGNAVVGKDMSPGALSHNNHNLSARSLRQQLCVHPVANGYSTPLTFVAPHKPIVGVGALACTR